jgi:quinol monooxygenase YgiN
MLGLRRMQVAFLSLVGLLLVASTAVANGGKSGPGKGYSQVLGGSYSIVAEVWAKRGKEAQLRTATLPLISLVRGDPKNLVYFAQEDRERPGHFIFYEIFATQADFEAHNAKPYVKDWLAKLPELADGPIKTTRMEILTGPPESAPR